VERPAPTLITARTLVGLVSRDANTRIVPEGRTPRTGHVFDAANLLHACTSGNAVTIVAGDADVTPARCASSPTA
jgi:hypothetical protein